MDESYLMATVRYVERNPIVVGLCRRVQDWVWSSAQIHLFAEDDLLVQMIPKLEHVGDRNKYLSDVKCRW
jgi:putative transposase